MPATEDVCGQFHAAQLSSTRVWIRMQHVPVDTVDGLNAACRYCRDTEREIYIMQLSIPMPCLSRQ